MPAEWISASLVVALSHWELDWFGYCGTGVLTLPTLFEKRDLPYYQDRKYRMSMSPPIHWCDARMNVWMRIDRSQVPLITGPFRYCISIRHRHNRYRRIRAIWTGALKLVKKVSPLAELRKKHKRISVPLWEANTSRKFIFSLTSFVLSGGSFEVENKVSILLASSIDRRTDRDSVRSFLSQ